MGKTMITTLCIFAAITVAAVAGPLDRSGSCARQCTESSKFKYENGKHYVYDYEMETVSTLDGVTNDASRMHMTASVQLHVISNCEMIMRLTGVTLEQSDSENSQKRTAADQDGSFRRALETYPLRFAFQNGRVENICPRDEETVDALNVKRAILSAFQTTTGNLEDSEKVLETDISGTCTTVYEAMPRGYRTQSIRKTKDLASCSDRENLDVGLQPVKSQPLLKGSQECTQTYRGSRLESVQCAETHLLRPFSRQQKNGAVTRVKLSLTYKTEGRSSFSGNEYFSKRHELNFDQSEMVEAQKEENVRMAQEALRNLCQASMNDIRPSVPRLFTNFVHKIQPLSHSDLIDIRRRIDHFCSGNERASKMFVDAVAMCGSAGAAKMVTEMASNGDLNEMDLNMYLSSLVFVKNPDRDMIAAVLPLLERSESFLGVSSLVHTYCTKNANCQTENQVQMIVRKISNSLGDNCLSQNKEGMMVALKALGNMGANGVIENLLRKCVENPAVGDEVRVAALQSYRRVTCQETPLNSMMDLFRNPIEKVEVRIAAFVAMMKCPNFEVISAVKEMLKDERMNQVGSFVYTFLNQITKSRREELDLVDLMDDVDLMNKFNTDFRKFSRAYESAFFLESMDLGANAKAQSVFTPEGFLPRSMMLNLTVDVFGNNVNLLELEGRAEGMERMVEALFGPEGYFRGNTNKNRKGKMAKEERAIELMGHKYNAKGLFQRDSVASIDLKIFGNSMIYKRFGMESTNTMGVNFDTMSLPEILTALAQQRDFTFTKSAVLFDTTFTIPTASGMPLKLTLDGTTSVDLKVKGKMDMQSLDNIDVAGVFQPSGAIEMSATMSVNAMNGVSTGLKVVATLHSSTMIDGLLQVRSGKLIKTQINVPRENIELFDLQTRVFLVKNNEEQSPAMASSNTVNTRRKCAGIEMMGMEMCGELELPSSRKGMPLFPLNGQTFFKAYLRKTDPSLRQYNFDMSYNTNEQNKMEILVKFNTPSSNVDRELSSGLQVDYKENDMTFNLFARSPSKKMAVTGKYINNDADRRLTFGVNVDESEKFSVEAAMVASEDESGMRYTPSLVVRGSANNARNLLTMRGNTLIRQGEKYSAELSLEDLTTKPVVVKGELSLGNRNEVQTSISCSALEMSLNGFISARKNAYATKATLSYKMMGSKRENVEVTGKFRDNSANSLVKYSGTSSMQSSAFPEYSTTIQFETQLTEGHVENSLELNVGDSKGGNLHKVTLQEILRYEGTPSNNKGEASFRIIYPQRDIDFLIKGEHQNTLNSASDKVTVRVGPKNEYVVTSNGLMEGRNVNGNFKIESTMGGAIANFEGEFRQTENNEYKTNILTEYMGSNVVKAGLTFSDKCAGKNTDYDVKTEVTIGRSRRPMTANLRVKATESRNYVANANMDMGSGVYALNTQYTFVKSLNHRVSALLQTPQKAYSAEGIMEGSSEQLTLNGNILANRRMTALISLLNTEQVKTCSIKLMADADRDTSKSFRLDSEYKCNSNKHQAQFTMSYPGKKMSGSIDGSLDGNMAKRAKGNLNAELEYDEGSKIRVELSGHTNKKSNGMTAQGDVKLQTPFVGMEETSLSIQHTESNNELKNEINAVFQRGKKISLLTEAKVSADPNNLFLDIGLRLATPFRNYEYMTGKTVLKANPADSSFTIMGRMSDKTIELSGAHSNEPFAITLNLTTPFISLNQASTFFTIETTKAGQFKSQVEVMYNNRNQYLVGIDANSEYSGKTRACSLEVTAVTTIRKYERMQTRVFYNHAQRGLSAGCDASVNNEKLTLSFTGMNRNNRYNRNAEGRFAYTSTMENYRNGEVLAKYTSDNNKIFSSLSGSLNNDVNFSSELNYNNADATEGSISFTGSNFLVKSCSVTGNFKLESTKLTANGLFNLGESVNRVDLSAVSTIARNQYNTHARFNMNAPDMGMGDVRFSFEHQRQQMLFTTIMSASSDRKEIKLSHELNIVDSTNFASKLNVNTPFRKYRSVSFLVDQSLNRGLLRHNSEVTVSGKKLAAASCEFNQRRESRYSSNTMAKLNLITPYETLSSLNIEGRYEMDSSRFFYQPRLIVAFNQQGQFNFDANVNNINNVPSALAKLTSTIPNMEDMAFSGKYDFNTKEKVVEGSFKYATEKEVTCRVAYGKDRNIYASRVTITTPFRGMKTMGYQGEITLKRHEKEANLNLNWENKKINLNGRYAPTTFSLSYATPYSGYETAALTGSYSGNIAKLDAELQCEYAPNNKMTATLTHSMGDKLNTRLVIVTPFRGYRSMAASAEVEANQPKKMASFIAQRDTQKPAKLTGTYEMRRDSLTVTLDMESSYKSAELIKFGGSFESIQGGYRMATNLQYGPEDYRRMTMSGEITSADDKKISFNLDTPFRPLKNVQFTTTLNNQQLRSSLQFDTPSNKLDLTCSLKSTSNNLEGNFDLRTNFRNMEKTSGLARYSNNREETKGQVELILPFQNLKYFEGEAILQTMPGKYNLELRTKYPTESSQTISLTGFAKSQTDLMEFRVNTENLLSNPTEISGSYKGRDLRAAEFNLNLNLGRRNEHSLFSSMKNPQHGEMSSEMKLRSSFLATGELDVKLGFNFVNKGDMTMDASIENRKASSKLSGTIKNSRQSFEYEMKVNSPYISKDEVTVQLSYSSRRTAVINGKATLITSQEPHSLEISFDGSDSKQIMVSAEARCKFINGGAFRIEGKMIEPKDNSVILTTNVICGGTHSMTAKYNYNNRPFVNIEGNLELESSLLPKRVLSISGNIMSESLKRFETTLTVDGLYNGQSRLTINLKRQAGRSLDGLVNLNLPTGPVRMFRADMKAKTDGTPQNSEFSLDVETSLQNVRHMSLNCKSKTSLSALDISVNARLPVSGMETLSLLTIVHKNSDLTRFTPRVTLSLPANKYVIFGNYENENALLASIGYEINSNKAEAGMELRSDEVKLNLRTPIRGHESYSLTANMKNERSKNILIINVEDARAQRSTFQGSMRYHSLVNFVLETSLQTPYRKVRDLGFQMRQQNRRGNLLTSISYNSEGKRLASLHVEHQTSSSSSSGRLEIVTPLETAQLAKMGYSYGDNKLTMSGEFNREKLMEVETTNTDEEMSFVVSLPTMPYTLKGSCKRAPALELNLLSIAPKRTMGFSSSTLNNGASFSHDTRVTFDEKENSVISYVLRLTPRRDGGRDIVARVNLPVRSVELRAEHAPNTKGAVVTFDILYDVSRNPNKNVKIVLEHSETSSYRTTSRKVQCTLSYPQLRKDIVARAEYSVNAKEFFARSEIEYSRDEQKKIEFEIRAQDQSQSRRECNYNVALLARNPAARVDMKINGDVMNNAEEMGASLKMNFLGQNGRERISELRTKIQKLKQKLEIETRLNEERMQLNGRMFNRDREFTLEFDQTVNSMSNMLGHLRLSGQHRTLDLSLSSGEETMNVKATMPGDLLHMELSHSNPTTSRVSDALFHLSLSKDRVLESRLNFRPELMGETKEKVNRMYTNANNRMSNTVNDYSEGANNELFNAAQRMVQVAEPELSPLKISLDSELNEINKDYRRVSYNLKQMYRKNDFYMRSIHETTNQVLQTLSANCYLAMESMSNGFQHVVNFVSDCCFTLAKGINFATKKMSMAYQNAQLRFIEMKEEMEMYLNDLVDDTFAYVILTSMDLMERGAVEYEYYAEKMGDLMEPVIKRMTPYFEQMAQATYNVMKMVENMISNNMARFCQSKSCQSYVKMMNEISYEDIRRAVSEYYRHTMEVAFGVVSHAGEHANAFYNSVRDNQQMNGLNEMATKAFDKARQTAYHLGIDTLALNLFEEMYAKTMKILYASLRHAFDEFSDLKSSVQFTMEPEKGRIELKMRLPVATSSLINLSELDSIDFSQLSTIKNNLFDPNSFSDFYYQYKKFLDPTFYIPPFNGKAIVAGNQHYVTFDNFHFDYAGECSYLLAKDFVDGNFTVYVNYVQDATLRAARKSIVTMADGVKVEVSNDYKVTKNDVKVELPQELTPGGVKVTLDEGTILIKDERRGFAVRCNLEHDICTLEVSGFYFAKTGGLLGSFNNEPAMDKMTPENKMTDNVEEFASSWKIGGSSCKTTNVAKESANEPMVKEECGKLFESDDSPMRSCFKVVSPRPFMNMCVNDLTYVRRENERQKRSCTAIAAYLERCRDEGVELRMPKHCIRCERHDNQEMEGGDMIKITSPSAKSSDIVFVIEQGMCNKDINQILARLANNLEDLLRSDGYKKIRFSVVGFGGEGIHAEPHVVTTDGKAFGMARSLGTTLENLPLNKNDESSNVFDALRYAARLPFLAGATKTFVLAKCSSCRAEEMKGDYSEMLRTMLDGDITLHSIFDLELKTRSANKAAKRVIGFDRKFAYSSKEVKDNDLGGDRDLFSQLRLPKDLCVPLSLEINGSVFITKKCQNKKNLDLFARRIIKTIQPPECQLCECLTTSYGIGKSVCQRCVSPVVASMNIDDLDPMTGFFDEKSVISNSEELEEEPEVVVRRPNKPKQPKVKNFSGKRMRKQN